MVGKRYGHLLVVAEAGRRYYTTSKPQRLIRVRCDCGNEYETIAHCVRRTSSRCAQCWKEDAADYQRAHNSVRLPNGKTIAQVAAASGLDLGTVYRRFLRGWPVEKLGAPLRTNGRRRGFGGSVDLPERRRTHIPGPTR
jgi:hypothetical protein